MMKFNTAVFALLFAFVIPARASEKIDVKKYFTPGNYTLSEGEDKLCGDGKFYISDDGSRIWLGPFYNFRTSPGVVTDKGGLSIDKDCTYRNELAIVQKGKSTHLTESSAMLCGTTKRQVITNEVVIEKHKITLDQSSLVDPNYYARAGGTPHHCAWTLQK